jgi:hypothetical protein
MQPLYCTISRLLSLLLLLIFFSLDLTAQEKKLNIVVLTDIEADPDDTQSLIRFLLYSNQWNVEALIATTSIHQKKRVAPESINEVLGAYKKIAANLEKHEAGFPSYESLRAAVTKGLPVYGMEGVGKGKDSEGSERIVKILDRNDDNPVWFSIWGGPNVLAQALWKIQSTKNANDAERIYRKIRIYTISDQDDSGPWIRKTFPSIFYIVSPGYNYPFATWLGIAFPLPGSNTDVASADWLARNIQQDHGPLGASYPDVAYGMEGDSPAFLGLISNGLNVPEHPDYGGWGGRYRLYVPGFVDSNTGRFKRDNWPKDQPETRAIWTNASDSVVSTVDHKKYGGNKETIWRWREEFQNDFASRILWTTKEFSECNHPPVPKLAHSESFTVKSGEEFTLSGKGTTDPDGDSMSYYWFQYREAGTLDEPIRFQYAPNLYAIPSITAPVVKEPKTVHFILKVTDKGTPALTRYKRVIVTIVPR